MTEAYQQVQNGAVLKFLKQYWFLLVFLVAAAFAWSEIRAQVEANRTANIEQNAEIERNNESIHLLNIKYVEDITFIKTVLEEFE